LGIILVSTTIIIVVVKIFYVITLTDPNSESRVKLLMSLNIYVPRDERFGHLKMSDFLAYGLKSIAQFLKPELESIFDSTPNEFDNFQDVLKLYEGGVKLPHSLLETIRDNIPAEMLKQIFPTDGEGLLKYPMPQVIKGIISFSGTTIS
jgi:linoleate 9S-lipoxygenase